ncbi:MAG: alkanesulfonate monooxygenase SsuD, partial [Bacteroidia bacterium]
MELGIDSFAAFPINEKVTGNIVLQQLLERITLADQVGLHSFGIGEHHRADFLDSAPTMILAAAAAHT